MFGADDVSGWVLVAIIALVTVILSVSLARRRRGLPPATDPKHLYDQPARLPPD